MITRGDPPLLESLRASIAISLPLAGIACGITLLFLGMRSVMEVGGACADGGPYVSAQPCPRGIPLAMFGGIWGGIICVGVYIWQTAKYRVPGLVAFAWPALFLSLGWNFLEYGINPPFGDGLAWGWLVCAVVFGLMGGLPLLAIVKPVLRSFVPRDPQGPVSFRASTPSLRPPIAARHDPGPASSAASRPTGSASSSLLTDLERLAALRDSGALTDAEFELAKRRILGGTP